MLDEDGPPRPLRVIALATFPVGAAATRLRVAQFIPFLASSAVEVTLLPFLSDAAFQQLYNRRAALRTALRLVAAVIRRVLQLPLILSASVVFVQREAMLFGPPWIEWLVARVWGIPLVLDLDDPTWIPVASPVYGRLATLLKWPSKTDRLIKWSRMVICGNETIANHVRQFGVPAVVIPTIVDTNTFVPRTDDPEDVPVVGWVGTHSTWQFVESLLPVFEQVAESIPFRLRIVGSGQKDVKVRGVEVELLPWRLDREVRDFQVLDVGIYPLPDNEWTVGKSGLKLIEYFAAGVPSIASPVGAIRGLGEEGVTHLIASSQEEWRCLLERLLRDAGERRAIGSAARQHAIATYSVEQQAAHLGAVVRGVASPARPVVPTGDTAIPQRLLRLLHVFPIVAFRGLAGGLPILIGLYIAHRWGLTLLGSYAFASSFVAVGLMIVDWGCTKWLPRELALVRTMAGSEPAAAATANGLRLILALAFLLLTGLLAVTGYFPHEAARFAMELGLLCPITIYSINGVSDRVVKREIGGIAWAVFAGMAIFGVLAVAANHFAPGPHGIVLAYVASRATEALVMMRGRSDLYQVKVRHLLTSAAVLWPFAMHAIIGTFYSRLTVFIVQYHLPQDLGLIGAASALQNVLLLFPVSIALLNYPALTTAASKGEMSRVRAIALASAGTAFVALSAAAVALYAVRNVVASALHIPPQSMPVVMAFAAIAWITIGTTHLPVLLQAMGYEKLMARLAVVTVFIAIVYQYTLIRWLGLWGVVAALACAEATAAIICGVIAWRITSQDATILRPADDRINAS